LPERENEDLLGVALVLPDFSASADNPLRRLGDELVLVLGVPEELLVLVLLDLVEIDERQIGTFEQRPALVVVEITPGGRGVEPEDLDVERLQLGALLLPILQKLVELRRIDRRGRGTSRCGGWLRRLRASRGCLTERRRNTGGPHCQGLRYQDCHSP